MTKRTINIEVETWWDGDMELILARLARDICEKPNCNFFVLCDLAANRVGHASVDILPEQSPEPPDPTPPIRKFVQLMTTADIHTVLTKACDLAYSVDVRRGVLVEALVQEIVMQTVSINDIKDFFQGTY